VVGAWIHGKKGSIDKQILSIGAGALGAVMLLLSLSDQAERQLVSRH